MRGAGISNVIATILLVVVAIALVIAISAFVFDLLGNSVRNPNWLLMYESLYNNYTALKRNYTLLLQQYEELQSKYEQLLNRNSQVNQQFTNQNACIDITYITPITNLLQEGSASSQNGAFNTSNSVRASINNYGSLLIYPNYFVYEVSNLSTFFVVLTIHNGLNTTVTLYNVTVYVDGDAFGNATIDAAYNVNSTDDVLITLFPGTRIGELASLGNYFSDELVSFNSTLPINITAVNILISYGYGNETFTYSYTVNQGATLNT